MIALTKEQAARLLSSIEEVMPELEVLAHDGDISIELVERLNDEYINLFNLVQGI